jgi:hypothetical protein
MALVTLGAPNGMALERWMGNGVWESVCSMPCSMKLPTAYFYRVVGDGFKTSSVFALKAPDGVPERLIVEGASEKWSNVGAVAIPTGLIVEMVGALGTVFNDAPVWAITTDVVGCVMISTGILLVLANWSTHVNQVIPPERRPAPDNYWQRYPTWRTKESMPEQRWLPPVAGIPIFSGTF